MSRHRVLLVAGAALAACAVLSALLLGWFDEWIQDRILVPLIDAYHAARIRWSLVSEELLWFPVIGAGLVILFRAYGRHIRRMPLRTRRRRRARIGEGEVPSLSRRIRRAGSSRFLQGRVSRELALTAARLVMRKEGCTFAEARRRVRQGTWTPDAVAGQLLSTPSRVYKADKGFAERLEHTLVVLEHFQQEG